MIDALRDLLADEDANARAVAAVSLARTDANDPITVKFLMKTLNDKDRLVREAGCLALGHLQARQAVNKLLHMWSVLAFNIFTLMRIKITRAITAL